MDKFSLKKKVDEYTGDSSRRVERILTQRNEMRIRFGSFINNYKGTDILKVMLKESYDISRYE
jgi:hypothetical protein